MDGLDIATAIISEGERISREKDGKALTPEEVKKVQASNFLQAIMAPPKEKK